MRLRLIISLACVPLWIGAAVYTRSTATTWGDALAGVATVLLLSGGGVAVALGVGLEVPRTRTDRILLYATLLLNGLPLFYAVLSRLLG